MYMYMYVHVHVHVHGVYACISYVLCILQLCELLEEHSEVFSTALAQRTPVSSESKVRVYTSTAPYYNRLVTIKIFTHIPVYVYVRAPSLICCPH